MMIGNEKKFSGSHTLMSARAGVRWTSLLSALAILAAAGCADNRFADRALGPNGAAPRLGVTGTSATWVNVTPANVNLTSSLSCGNFGTENVQVDPNKQSNFYAQFHCQGIWKSVDYGLTWTGPINTGTNGATVSDCAGGIRLAPNGSGNAPILYQSCMRGAAIGFWRSLDGGVNWTRSNIAPAAGDRQDVSPPSVDPYDSQHLIMAANGRDLLVESVDGGQTWTNVPINAGMRTSGGTGSISFIKTGNAASTRGTFLWIAQQSGGNYGTWRTTSAAATWTQVDKNEHATGFAEAYQPDASGVVYMAGAYAQSGWGVMRSADYGATWTHVGSNSNQRAVFGTPSAVYSSFSYPSGFGATNGPDFQMASQPGTSGWTASATPVEMKQGASQAAVGFDGTSYSVVTANYGAGLWRYTDAASGAPVGTPVADVTPSMMASTFTSTPDTVIVGSAAAITITARNAAGMKLGSGLAVTLAKAGGITSDVLSAVTFVAADSTYRATLTPMGVATPMTLTASIGGSAVPVARIVVAKAAVATPVTPLAPVTPGTWVNVTPSNVNLSSSLSCGNYGTENVQVDPNQQSNFYAQFHCQGIWKSVDYGRTWTGPINTGTNGATVSDCAGGLRLAPNGAGNPPILYQACIRGAAIGFWRSLDGGVNWTRYNIAPAAGNRQDVYPPNVDPYDSQHLIMAGHEQDLLVESVNGGQTWTSVPVNTGMRTGSGTGAISFIKTGNAASTRGTFLWMAQQSGGVYGTWRTTNGGASWTQVDKNEHPHGFAEAYQPDASGVVYIAGAYGQSGWGVMRSADYGATWTHVGSNTNQRTVFGTPSAVYSSFSYPTGLGTTNEPDFQLTSQPGMSGWTSPATPSAMKQGASQAAVGFDGTKYSVVTANYGAGLWLYTVAAGGTPVPPPVVDKTPSLTVSTFSSTPDTVILGSAAAITITPRNAAGIKLGSGLAVTLSKAGGTISDVLSAVTFVAADSTYRATLTLFGVATPTTLTASIGGSTLAVTRTVVAKATVAAPPPPTSASWTFCTKVGPYCEPFEGQRRDVRLVSTLGASVTQTAFGFIACNRGAFQALPRGSVEDHCDYGKMQTEVVTNPYPGMSGLTASAVTVPLGDWGESTVLTRPSTSLPPAGGAEGNFRTVCNLVKMAAFDPIVYPGQPLAGHLHMFFGNVDVNPNSTPQSLASSGNSSCFGGIMNRTGYWVPAVFDAVSGEVQVPVAANFYYKNGILDPATIQPIPAGLRMIAGDKNATKAQANSGWNCQLVWNQQAAVDGMIPNCAVGDAVVLDIRFPECWDGVNLDSPDHKSHMAYAIWVNAPGYQSYCPFTHPVPIPRITEIFRFPVTASSRPLNWRLTSDMYSLSIRGGLSAHADWMDGWSRDGMTTFVKNCVNARRDCTAQLGDGRDVYYRR